MSEDPTIFEVDDPALPPVMRAVGSVFGIPVVEDPRLKYDEVYPSIRRSALVVGEVAQFRYWVTKRRLDEECRRAARRHIEAKAAEILGEPWECQ